MIRAVIDTNVLFEGLTPLGPSAKIVDAWVNGHSVLVTQNIKDFAAVSRELGFQVFRPSEFLTALAQGGLP